MENHIASDFAICRITDAIDVEQIFNRVELPFFRAIRDNAISNACRKTTDRKNRIGIISIDVDFLEFHKRADITRLILAGDEISLTTSEFNVFVITTFIGTCGHSSCCLN